MRPAARPPRSIVTYSSAVGYPPVEAREEKKAADGKPAAQESLVSLLVNDCLKWVHLLWMWVGGR